MKISSMEVWPVKMRLTEPYTIAYETISAVENIFLRIETGSGICGFGCAAPDEQVTGETPLTVMDAFNDIIAPVLRNSDPLRIAYLLDKMAPALVEHPSAVAMVGHLIDEKFFWGDARQLLWMAKKCVTPGRDPAIHSGY